MALADFEAGRAAATLVLDDAPEASETRDPRTAEFAAGALAEFSQGLQGTRGFMRRMVDGAEAAAEDLAVEVFQGLVEVLQNADDLRAHEVRIAVRRGATGNELLIVHDGEPVTVQHVLAMNLPFLTTKSDDDEKLGRFGIGLKTLGRIAGAMDVHGAPYHFAAKGLSLHVIEAAPAIPGFYEPGRDTMLALELRPTVPIEDLEAWFIAWPEDNLLFLRSVRRFRMTELETGLHHVKSVEVDDWVPVGDAGSEMGLRRRNVRGSGCAWLVYSADCPRPSDIDRSHKATGAFTRISIAVADGQHQAGVFIAFRTRLPVTLPFSIDAQFDPTAAREGLIENEWNKWLVKRCGDVVAAVARQRLAEAPQDAWGWVPLPTEKVGVEDQPWPSAAFAQALDAARASIGAYAALLQGGELVPVNGLAYEASLLTPLLTGGDIEALAPGKVALQEQPRGNGDRWRSALASLKVATFVGFVALAKGFHDRQFDLKPTTWWIEAATLLAENRPEEEVLGTPCWLTDGGEPVACRAKGSTERPLLLGPPLSDFARRWNLMLRLHDAYTAEGEANGKAAKWLLDHAAVTTHADPALELAAFAETFSDAPHAVTDDELRELQRRFDELPDRRASPIGLKVGAAIMLDGYAYRGGRKVEQKVAPAQAYLSRRIDSDNPDWPDAADGLPGILWVSGTYDDRLRSGPRGSRRRADGMLLRGPRRFLMLLGALCWPRVVPSEGVRRGGSALRQRELRAAGAEYVKSDYVSPDLERVLSQISRASKKEKKARSAALIRVLARHWDRFAHALSTPSFHEARVYVYPKDAVTSHWLALLVETAWVAVGNGALVVPGEAVVKTQETQSYYTPDFFISGITLDDLRIEFRRAMKFITDVRASDLTKLLMQIRDSGEPVDTPRVLQLYRSLAKLCPRGAGRLGFVGDLMLAELQRRFSTGRGLIWVQEAEGGAGAWRRPSQLFRGRDIFHEPELFVPAGPSYQDLWLALGVEKPGLEDCANAVRRRARRPYSPDDDPILIDIYHYMETLSTVVVDRSLRDRLRSMPVVAVDKGWVTGRPVFHIADRELRRELASARPDLKFWAPPWDVDTVVSTVGTLGLTTTSPTLKVRPDGAAAEAGEVLAERFRRAVEQLSNELARNDPATREALSLTWENLRELPLSIYEAPFEIQAVDPDLSAQPIRIQMRAVLDPAASRFHICRDALPERESGGRAIASLFAPGARRRVEAEWVVAWVSSADKQVQMMRMASDEAQAKALEDLAATAAAAPKAAVKVTPAASKAAAAKYKPRVLKAGHGAVANITITTGSPPKPPNTSQPLAASQPPPPAPPRPPSSAPPSYTTADLEQRGWEILTHVLNTSNAKPLVDFRARRQIGADGVINWKTFVELKATGRGPSTSSEMSNSEYERALERGQDFILALVSGLEEGEHSTEVRLIIDPARCAAVRPLGGVRLSGLLEAPSVVIQFDDGVEEPAPAEAGAE